jgi:hypothetical protein
VFFLSLVSDGETKVAQCGFNENQTTSTYYYLLTTVYPPFELAVFFCLPLLINIFCTILIVRSLRIRMRTAKQFQRSKINLKDQTLQSKSHGILTYFLPRTTGKSDIHSCLCFQVQCRKHTRIRLKMGGTKRSLNKYEEENQSIDRQRSTSLSTYLSQDSQPQLTPRPPKNILDKKHRTRRSRDIHLSAMLISLNILYLILNLPFNLHQTFVEYLYNPNSDPCTIKFISLLLDALQQTFFSTNFFLYVLTNRRFREEFYNTITKILSHCRKNSSTKILNNQNQRYGQRAANCNPPVNIDRTNDNPMIPIINCPYRDSIISDIEVTETSPSQHQTM